MRLPFRLLVYSGLIGLIFIPWLAWETDSNQVRRWLYPLKGQLAAWSTICATQTPDWLKQLSKQIATTHDSPANQLAYVSVTGKLSSCINGWEGTPLFSPRVTPDTPLRLASLSKIVSFMGLVGEDEQLRTDWIESFLTDHFRLASPTDARVNQIRIRHLLNHSAGFDRHRTEDPITRLNHQPWCPHDLRNLARITLDYTPATRYSYHNLDYCLAEAAYEQYFGHSLWEHLLTDFRLHEYGVDWLVQRDTPVAQNLMHESLTGLGWRFAREIDWEAARAPMGMTGNARGLAAFISDNRPLLAVAQSMRDDSISCDETRNDSCFDGFLNRVRVGDHLLWQQRGYLYGMAALFLLDEEGNLLIWLGTGEGRPLSAAAERVKHTLLEHTSLTTNTKLTRE